MLITTFPLLLMLFTPSIIKIFNFSGVSTLISFSDKLNGGTSYLFVQSNMLRWQTASDV